MGIGFLSFGGMLTGGDEEVKETPEVVVVEATDIKKEIENQTKIVN
jgi:Na+-transporting NADH:ubiquinone oxidoreductase subunit E